MRMVLHQRKREEKPKFIAPKPKPKKKMSNEEEPTIKDNKQKRAQSLI